MSDEQFHEIMDVAESIVDKEIHEKCLLGSGALVIWNGLTDEWEEGDWVNPYTKETSTGSLWQAGSPDGGNIENCIKTRQDRKWGDVDCVERNCALCHFPRRMNLTLRRPGPTCS